MSQFDYTTRDFSTIRAELLDRATRSIPEWTDRNNSDFMMALIDLWAYAADVLHYYVDRAAGEAFLPTATQRESVLAFANLYDYTPNGVNSAVASVQVSNDTAASVSFPIGTTFTANNDGETLGFYSTIAVTVQANTSGTIPVRQGIRYLNQSVTSTAGMTVSNGQPGQRFALFHKSVDPLSISVNVYEGTGATAVEWRQVSRLATSSANDAVYSVYVAADGTVYIVFGNGVNGRIPPNTVSIKTSYAVTSGEKGNVPANSITSISSGSYPGVKVVSSTAGIGGSDAENIESIKAAIPRAVRTQGRAVTLSDFADLALGVYGVSKAAAEYSVGNNPTGGSVTVYVVTYQPDYLTSTAASISVDVAVRERVYGELINSAMLGISTIAVPDTISVTPIFIDLNLFVKDNYVTEVVKSNVNSAVTSHFDFSKVSFGQIVTIGEFYRTILAVDGVDYAVITAFNTTGTPNSISANGKIEIDPYKLPKKGVVTITASGGVSPPI